MSCSNCGSDEVVTNSKEKVDICKGCGYIRLYTIEEWKTKTRSLKRVIPSGECKCAGCNKRLKARKYNVTWYDHLEDHDQPSKYCRECIENGHNLCFPRSYEEIILPSGKKRYGKRLKTTEKQIAIGENTQRNMHDN